MKLFNENNIILYLVGFLSMFSVDGKKVTKCIVRPKLTTTTTTSKAPQPSGSVSGNVSLPSITNGITGKTTRYWDCCLPSCSWTENTGGSAVQPCLADGVTKITNLKNLYMYGSGCEGGSAYLCNSNQPWALNENIAFGFAAAAFTNGGGQQDWCCSCYRMQFTSGNAMGKQMIVQVVNTGYDLSNNHFDLQIPGGGVGNFNGCESQWSTSTNGWGERYGGISSSSQCSSLPSQLHDGCNWRFNWFMGSDNPEIVYERVKCPVELTDKSGCIPANNNSQKEIPWIYN